VAEVGRFLQQVGGPMADPSCVPPNFVQRRVLDKLMYFEGRFVKEGKLPA
jgi:hypothetical protein